MNATDFGPLLVSYEDVAGAARRIEGKARRTPVMTSATVDERTGAQAFFKCENFQRMGAFKFRGAYNALSLLSPEEKSAACSHIRPAIMRRPWRSPAACST